MEIIKIKKSDWAGGIDKSRKTYHLFGPVKHKNHHIFRQLENNIYPDMEYMSSVLSPKSVLFPQSQKILVTSADASGKACHIFTPPEQDHTPRAVIGIRPCDAKAVQLVKLNFDTKEYQDPYWCSAFEATTFVGLAVNTPSVLDFSTSAGSGPFAQEGLDVLLVDCKDHYLAKILSQKGKEFLNTAGFNEKEDPKAADQVIQQMKISAEKAICSVIQTQHLKKKTVLELYEAPFWEDIAFSCISCGTCAYVCPTCWCFDIQDETQGKTAVRFRNWDTCMPALFTRHSSGHNPRGEKIQRVRQRFMHKLKYFDDKYDQGIMCIGCGRCVEKCPVNIDIRDICNLMNAYKPEKESDAGEIKGEIK
ncbi:MAG: 4Fe-4S dicluster domain-containing protein [Proteobacteria bacterium]|nr:4Fe-4S dicluster domain-containing protein [Pseudomonadota bacterium]MBU1386874.1 4Fe-4S dicluster domain-containing protein [Pseudomonadota bacterium]MBU1541441.1 4Fe-4S dicluster domain-containing protein [Pseudomonadota bacterium]MBU2480173.1 4Fe-4S dicluster domain-containing protein [Pseudomonadota bacterium]